MDFILKKIKYNEHDKDFVHIAWATKRDTKNFHVSCVYGTAGLPKSIGLGKVGQREKDLRLEKKYYTLSFD